MAQLATIEDGLKLYFARYEDRGAEYLKLTDRGEKIRWLRRAVGDSFPLRAIIRYVDKVKYS